MRRQLVFGVSLFLSACSGAREQTERSSDGAPYIALRLVVPENTPGAERAQHGDSNLFLASQPFLSDTDLVRVAAEGQTAESVIMRVHCRPAACERLARLTADHIGRSLAVVIASRVRGVAPIMSSVGAGGSLTIAADASGPDAEGIVEQIRMRWPPQ